MKYLVVYQSKTGFTEQYARWIAEKLQCESVPLNKVTKAMLGEYDRIVYGGWVLGNVIMGLDKFLQLATPACAVFAVGSSPADNSNTEAIQSQNKLGETPLFYMEGGFRYEKLGLPYKLMLNMVKKSVAKKADKTKQDLYMEKVLGTSFDHMSESFVQPLVLHVVNKGS